MTKRNIIPLLIAALVGAWVIFDMAEIAFALYAVIYLLLGYAAMLAAWWIARRKCSIQ